LTNIKFCRLSEEWNAKNNIYNVKGEEVSIQDKKTKSVKESIADMPTINDKNFKDLPIAWQTQIKEDRKFGVAVPYNNKYFTFRCYDEDTEVPKPVAEYIIDIAYSAWEYDLNINVKIAPEDLPDSAVDFKLYFKTTTTDKNLRGSTLAYHYYPISHQSEYKGICVINKEYFYNINGENISLGIIDPLNYRPDEKKKGRTYNLVKILRHEFGHGLLGLPHTGESGHTMSALYNHMSEDNTEFDITRGLYKVGAKKWKSVDVKNKVKKWYSTKKSKSLPDELKPLVKWN